MVERVFKTLEDAEEFYTTTTRAQSMLLAAVLRPLIANGSLGEYELVNSLGETEKAALQRRTPETPAIAGLVQMLRQDLRLPEGTGHVG
jgi:hypothetical protein